MKNQSLSRMRMRCQQGVVLVVVMVLLVAMMLGGMSLMRSIDVSTLLSSNLSFKRDTLNQAGAALNDAAVTMKTSGFFNNTDAAANAANATTWRAARFWPIMLAADANGIPTVLTSKTAYKTAFGDPMSGATITNGNEVRYVIERMCTDYGVAKEETCVFGNGNTGGQERTAVGGSQGNPGGAGFPMFRITIRTDGPRGTLTYTQAIMSLDNTAS